MTQLFHQEKTKFESKIKGLEVKSARLNNQESRRRGFGVTSASVKSSKSTDKTVLDEKTIKKLDSKMESFEKTLADYIKDQEEKLNENKKITNINLKKIEDTCNVKTLTQSVEGELKPKILKIMDEKLSKNTDICQLNLMKVEKKASDNYETLTQSISKGNDNNFKQDAMLRTLGGKIQVSEKRVLDHVRTTNLHFSKLSKDFDNLKLDFSKRKN